MNALTGMEKFSHLEDKIYLTIEYAKKMRDGVGWTGRLWRAWRTSRAWVWPGRRSGFRVV